MEPWLLLDVETSGTDPKVDRLVEVGAVLFDPNLGIPVRAESVLIDGESNAAEAINRIPAAALRGTWCVDELEAHRLVYELSEQAQYILAHQASFDRSWFPAEISERRWICTMDDASWPRCHKEGAGLATVALSYDVGVVRAHRAIEDVLTLAAILGRVHEIEGGLQLWLTRALEPRNDLMAEVLYGDERAKELGFRWDGDAKEWRKRARISVVERLIAEAPFPVAHVHEESVELIGMQGYDNNQLAKDAGFRWDGERKIWVRRVRRSVVGIVRDSLGFKTKEAA